MRTTTNLISSTTQSVPNPITMNISASKTMTMLNRLRQQQEPKSAAPLNSKDEDDNSTVQNIFVKKSPINNASDSDHQEPQPDLYTPLSYDEADENQLVDFFTTIDIDASFGGFDNVINNLSDVPLNSSRQSAKRRRLSNGGDSCSTSFSDEMYDYDGAELQRKQGAFGTDSSLENAPVE